MEDVKNLVPAADRARDALMKLRGSRYVELMRQLTSLAGQLQELTCESRKMGASLAHGWFAAAERCRRSVSRLLGDVSYSVSKIRPSADAPQMEIPRLSLLLEELTQVQQEFGDLEFNQEEDAISVITEPITLEEVYLGPFRIQLGLNRFSELYRGGAYHVIALEPNPAATDDSVTHPHVSSEKLCEGDACVTIRAALEQGRLCDFFTLVRGVLNTYNPDSPYVALGDWDGTPCYECGYVMNSDSCYYCGFCDHAFCDECTTVCSSCSEVMCTGCAGKCESCEEPVCPRCCRTRCTECERICCESCMDDGLCPECKEERENEDEEERTSQREDESQADSSEIRVTG